MVSGASRRDRVGPGEGVVEQRARPAAARTRARGRSAPTVGLGGEEHGPGRALSARSRPARRTVHWSTIRPSLAAGIPKIALGRRDRGDRTRRRAGCRRRVRPPRPRRSSGTARRGAARAACVEQRRRTRRPRPPERSAPAQKCPPAPVSTSTREPRPACAAARPASRRSSSAVVVERVASLGPIDREQRAPLPRSRVDHRRGSRAPSTRARASRRRRRCPRRSPRSPVVTVSSGCR